MTTDTAVRTTPSARRRRRVRRLSKRDRIVIALMIGVPLLLDLALIWGPAVSTFFLSFTNAHGAAPSKNIGAQNYTYMRTIDPDFWPALRHNVIWLIEFTVLATPLGVLLAVLLDRGIRGSRVYQSIFFLPVMLSLALIGIIWELMYGAQFGLINGVLGKTSPNDAINWLGDPKLNLWAVLVEATWRQAGYVMVLYLAGLKAFDPALREAAQLDGANAWQLFWRVTFPTLRPINNVILVVTVIESLRAFDLVYVTNGGTNGLQLLSAMITQDIVGPANRIGYGSALGVVLLVISLVPITYFLVQQFRKSER
ncbi:MAG: binding-protein-dependent transport system inner rane component [Jatrophihabitans sp.]|jgi:ABC-type sugar transport system permease subunit|nr:binding-protein-dependent transport system inner rane component [Jatrophihabitans sp.]MCW2656838.1 binding-protein-dependent transport system inner rane component [Jatrophihabitans sp.]MDT4904457.1 multiple sugar transport system permease protein [Pseudonocardiales bacterium]MDT4929659.1 multiple sugar transport system permease protein [Pseudonocardiales bacterium]MDT4951268.1 multiple sugar transport system permease protein [Pseudonocardiales bacterium]